MEVRCREGSREDVSLVVEAPQVADVGVEDDKAELGAGGVGKVKGAHGRAQILVHVGPVVDPVQGWSKRFILGCVIRLMATVASSRNLGHAFLTIPVHVFVPLAAGQVTAGDDLRCENTSRGCGGKIWV